SDRVMVHPQYVFLPLSPKEGVQKVQRDIAVLHLAEPVADLEVAQIASAEQGKTGVVVAYGDVGNEQDVRQSIDVNVTSVDDGVISAQGIHGGGLCRGASGSALFEPNSNHMIGLVSTSLSPQCSPEDMFLLPKLAAEQDFVACVTAGKADCGR